MIASSILFAAIAISTNGVLTSRIQVPQFSSRLEQKAGMELRAWLIRSAGTGPMVLNQIRDGLDAACPTEIVPTTLAHGGKLVPKAAREKLEASKSPDAFVIATREDDFFGPGIYIVGKTDAGVLYGAYAFLEDYVGLRFFHAGPEGTYVPKLKGKTLAFEPGLCDFREPAVASRRVQTWYGSVKPLDQIRDVDPWQARRGLQFASYRGHEELPEEHLTHMQAGNRPWQGGGETMLRDGVPITLFESHPEYFPLVDGKRSREAAEKQMRRCLSNPEVKKMVIRHALRSCAHSPSYGVDYRDKGGGWCQCTNCIAYGTGQDGKYSVPNYAHRFSKEVTDAIFADYPDARASILIYRDYRSPISTDTVFDKRVFAHFCPHQRCYAHALDDPSCALNGPYRKMYDFWRTRAPSIGFFDYYCYSDTPYCPVEWVLEKDFKSYFARDGFHCWIEDCSGGSSTNSYGYILNNWQMYYLASKLLWNPKLDAAQLFDEAYSLYYGPAAQPMKAYHAYRKALWETAPGHSFMSNYHRWHYALGVVGAEKKLKDFLNEAEKLAQGDNAVQTRVRLDRKMLDMFWVAAWNKVRDKYRPRPDASTPSIDMPPNGDFRILADDGFPKNYGADKKHFDGEAVVCSNSVFYSFIDNPIYPTEKKVRITVEADGTGELHLGMPYCIREPGNGEQVRMDKRLALTDAGGKGGEAKYKLTGPRRLVAEGTLPPYARCYIFFYGQYGVRLKSVRVEFPES